MLKINVVHDPSRPEPYQAIQRCRSFFQKHGYDFNAVKRVGGTPDWWLVYNKRIDEIKDSKAKIVVFESGDCATFGNHKLLDDPRVHRIWKTAVLRPASLQTHTRKRYHVQRYLSDDLPPYGSRSGDFEKVLPGPSYSMYGRLGVWIKKPLDVSKNRPYDAHFMGKATYGERLHITNHRKTLCKILNKIPGNHQVKDTDKGGIPHERYNDLLLKSKIVVSPWGYGELCWRDCEAYWAGCVLIKPDSDFVRACPDMFRDDRYVRCLPDWSDLKEKIDHVLGNWGQYNEQRKLNRKLMEDAYTGKCLLETIKESFI